MSVLHFFLQWQMAYYAENWGMNLVPLTQLYDVCVFQRSVIPQDNGGIKGHWSSGIGFPAFFFEVDCRSTAERGYIVYTVYLLLCVFIFTIVYIYRFDISIYKKHTYMFFECLGEKTTDPWTKFNNHELINISCKIRIIGFVVFVGWTVGSGWSTRVSPQKKKWWRTWKKTTQIPEEGIRISRDFICTGIYMDVSENSGTPKSSIFIGFSIINHPLWGTPIFGNTHI